MKRFAQIAALGGSRILDQALWSSGFFFLNVAAGLAMDIKTFASFSVITAIGLIGVGVARPVGVDSAVVFAARSKVPIADALDRRRMLFTASVMGSACSLLAFLTSLSLEDVGTSFAFGLVAFLLVFADAPRYFLIYARRFNRSLILSVAYAGLNGALAGLVVLGAIDWRELILAWVLGASLVAFLGLGLLRNACGAPNVAIRGGMRFSIAMGAESLYVGLAGQAALFVLFALGGYDDTAGIRLAYSLVLAPVFMLIQGLTPLLMLRFFADTRTRRDRVTALTIWLCGIAVALTVVVIAAFTAYSLDIASALLAPTLVFLIPLALSLFAGQVFEAGAMTWRLSQQPRAMHNLRLAVVTADIAGQTLGIYLGGADGLVVAFICIAVAKTAIGVLMMSYGKPTAAAASETSAGR